jgi:hypothetical protein
MLSQEFRQKRCSAPMQPTDENKPVLLQLV